MCIKCLYYYNVFIENYFIFFYVYINVVSFIEQEIEESIEIELVDEEFGYCFVVKKVILKIDKNYDYSIKN